jgi:hypothetical protein
MHLFGLNCDHDYYFELLGEEDRDAQSISRCSTAHQRDVRAVPRANRTCSTADSPIPGASSSTDEPLVVGPSLPWWFSVRGPSSNGRCTTMADQNVDFLLDRRGQFRDRRVQSIHEPSKVTRRVRPAGLLGTSNAGQPDLIDVNKYHSGFCV